MRQLGLLFGSTSQAAAAALAAFFLGMAAGNAWSARIVPRLRRPLMGYALLELGVAATALPFLYFQDVYQAVFGAIFLALEPGHSLLLILRIMLALATLFPPSFFLGATLPAMVQHLVGVEHKTGHTASALYLVNTLGGALGAYTAGFHLPPWLGYSGSYLGAVGLTMVVALCALVLCRLGPKTPVSPSLPASTHPSYSALARHAGWIAFAAGTLTLVLEVLSIRAFSQVLHNSTYTYAAVLMSFLLGLTLGAGVAWALARLRCQAWTALVFLLTAVGLATAASPHLLVHCTNGLEGLGPNLAWSEYIAAVFGTATLVVVLPAALGGSILPLLFQVHDGADAHPGAIVGRLVALNTMGAVLGSVVGGFFAIQCFGLWPSFRWIALCYLIGAVAVGLLRRNRTAWIGAGIAAVCIPMVVTVVDPGRLSPTFIRTNEGEQLVRLYEGGTAQVAVTRNGNNLRLKVNNKYVLGDTLSAEHEERQAHLPLLLHPAPRRVFFLGLGTGITAGSSLRHPIQSVVVCELVPGVIKAARTDFAPHLNGLFSDPRARVVAEDGRFYLGATQERFDLVIADLFTPWRMGVGSLYTVEHYRIARKSLAEGGIFVQWLPLYQLSRAEFETIARTLMSVFEQVTLWRGDFLGQTPIVALIGTPSQRPLDYRQVTLRVSQAQGAGIPNAPLGPTPDGIFVPWRAPLLSHYCGNLTAARHLMGAGQLATDNRPLIEFSAPITHRQVLSGKTTWFVGRSLGEFLDDLHKAIPAHADPYLAKIPPFERRWIKIGREYHLRRLRLPSD